MPFVRISLPKKLSLETKNSISEAVHQSLIAEFHIPKDDYFHVIEELESHQIKYPESYLGISHSEEIIYVQITAGQGRTLEQKKNLYHQIASKISTSTEILINNIIIVLLENNGLENWSFGNGEIQEPKHLKK
ncbi:tautomerase family protein [Flavobacterium hibernum]|uniref:4-oxalocrotonate tautomerase n=1 Tax=Flavobacterium hibernum TaxID=37752 RepID=A0A0D0EE43_9FLAO|nr:tautomerase family protein [Flavobacterium hibernum]KIO51704.1 4-oxalocrotonate tautomerase [Flavobacterium hibernum]OXA91735.1 tautomerase family protein [Flavobacterium hibernum]PTT15593.1 tautomerase family protein [Flavobacterium sp. HMWF030]STO09773.1 4-oxalocrotonate tautomerase [Flavobacterium hibernum]